MHYNNPPTPNGRIQHNNRASKDRDQERNLLQQTVPPEQEKGDEMGEWRRTVAMRRDSSWRAVHTGAAGVRRRRAGAGAGAGRQEDKKNTVQTCVNWIRMALLGRDHGRKFGGSGPWHIFQERWLMFVIQECCKHFHVNLGPTFLKKNALRLVHTNRSLGQKAYGADLMPVWLDADHGVHFI